MINKYLIQLLIILVDIIIGWNDYILNLILMIILIWRKMKVIILLRKFSNNYLQKLLTLLTLIIYIFL